MGASRLTYPPEKVLFGKAPGGKENIRVLSNILSKSLLGPRLFASGATTTISSIRSFLSVSRICGYIHTPADKMIHGIHYLNAGDWVETMSAVIEDFKGNWEVRFYDPLLHDKQPKHTDHPVIEDILLEKAIPAELETISTFEMQNLGNHRRAAIQKMVRKILVK